MRPIFSVALVLVAFTMAEGGDGKQYYDVGDAPNLFEKFVKDFSREYKDEADKEVHYQAFKENLGKMNKLNKDSPSATFGINKFADYTPEETQAMRGFRKKD